jgi:Phospholipase_D-nuclease N-terminal
MAPLAASTVTWVFILLPLVVVWIIGLVDIFRRELSRQAKAGWILIVVVLPLVGTLVYFLLRKPTKREIQLAQRARAERPDDSEARLKRGVPSE